MGLVLAGAGKLAPAALAQAPAGPSSTVNAAFSPDRLGAATTISFGASIDPPAAGPIPLSGVSFSFPSDLGLATSGLGVASCEASALQLQGPTACPADSKMGQGSALVEVPFGPTTVQETVSLGIYAAPSNDGYVHLAVLAAGSHPVIAAVVMAGVLYPGRLQITIPPIASLPEAPYVSLVTMQVSLGGALTYYELVHGRRVAYHPAGIGLPEHCPRGGWRLGASFTFTNGQSSHSSTLVRCPRRAGHRR